MVRGILAAVVAFALDACAGPQLLGENATSAQSDDTALHARIEASTELVIAGERLNVPLLKKFYARHGFEPVWEARPAQAASLVKAVLDAGDQGLDPDMFHARLLRQRVTLPPLDRELLLSDAFLSYADALARGAVPIERRRDDEVLTPGPIDVAAALDAGLDSADAGAAIEALAPSTPTYMALRQALSALRSGAGAGHKFSTARLQTIEVNLERQRWLPRSMPPDRVWVNVADQSLTLYRAGRSIFSTRVVVGEDVRDKQTPEFRATIDAAFFDPPWVIPQDIVKAEILPKVSRNPDYLARNHMIMLADGEAEQLPGPDAGLGYVMIDMPNRFDVYLHDTPDRSIFNLADRQLSHGCIRVQDARDFAALLLPQPISEVDQEIAIGHTTRQNLSTPAPVFVVYETAFLGPDGQIQYRPDFYRRDAEIWRALQRSPERRAKTETAKTHTHSLPRSGSRARRGRTHDGFGNVVRSADAGR